MIGSLIGGTVLKLGGIVKGMIGNGAAGGGGIFQRIKTRIQQNRLDKGKPLFLKPSDNLTRPSVQGFVQGTKSALPAPEPSFIEKYKVPLIGGGILAGLGILIAIFKPKKKKFGF